MLESKFIPNQRAPWPFDLSSTTDRPVSSPTKICSVGIREIYDMGTRYDYLPWNPQGINTVTFEYGAKGVLSANFSGCIMALIAHRGTGEQLVCHVSTGTTTNFKKEWDNATSQMGDYLKIKEFIPSDVVQDYINEMKRILAPNHSMGWICGLVTEQQKFYVIVTSKSNADFTHTVRHIVEV